MSLSLRDVAAVLYYMYPLAIGLSCIITFVVSDNSATHAYSYGFQRKHLVILLALFWSAQFSQLIVILIRSFLTQDYAVPDYFNIGSMSCLLLFAFQLRYFLNASTPQRHHFYASWLLAIPFDISTTLLSATTANISWSLPVKVTIFISLAIRCFILGVMAGSHYFGQFFGSVEPICDEERDTLLPPESSRQPREGIAAESTTELLYGSIRPRNDNTEVIQRSQRVIKSEDKDPNRRVITSKDILRLLPAKFPGEVCLLHIVGLAACLLVSILLNILIYRQIASIIRDLVHENKQIRYGQVVSLITLYILASDAGIGFLLRRLWIPIKCAMIQALTCDSYSHLLRLSIDYHESNSLPSILALFNGVEAVVDMMEMILIHAIPWAGVWMIMIFYLSFIFGPYQGFIVTMSGVALLLLFSNSIQAFQPFAQSRIEATQREFITRYNGILGWKTINALNQSGYEENRHANAVTARWCEEQKHILAWGIEAAQLNIALVLFFSASFLCALEKVQCGYGNVGQFAMLLMFWSHFRALVYVVSNLGQKIADSILQGTTLIRFLGTESSIQNFRTARPRKPISGRVDLKDVAFATEQNKPIIDHVNLHVNPGQTISLVGSEGSGKSMLLKLIARWYDVNQGSVQIDGQDIRNMDLSSLRANIGLLSEPVYVFHDTMMNNIRYSRTTATDAEVRQACKAASLHDDILKLPQGYGTVIGNGGLKLSSADNQKLAIARELLRNPVILLLDEATSAVDAQSEEKIQASLKKFCQDRTTFVVCNRLSIAAKADRILFMENGRVAEEGTHQELLLANGGYAKLWLKYSSSNSALSNEVNRLPETVSHSNEKQGHSCSQTEFQRQRPVAPSSPNRDKEIPGSSQHIGENSKLNPVAPTFTPKSTTRSARAVRKTTETSSDESMIGRTLASSHTSRQWSEEVEDENKKPHLTNENGSDKEGVSPPLKAEEQVTIEKPGVASKSPQPKANYQSEGTVPLVVGNVPKIDMIAPVKEEGREIEESTDHVPGLARSHFKLPRYSRRVQSKSEPSHAQDDSQPEACPATVTEDKADNERANRRVSAPIIPPAKAQSHIPKPQVKTKSSPQTRPAPQEQKVPVEVKHPPVKQRRDISGGSTISEQPKVPLPADDKGLAGNLSPSVQRMNQRENRRGRGHWYRGRRTRGSQRS